MFQAFFGSNRTFLVPRQTILSNQFIFFLSEKPHMFILMAVFAEGYQIFVEVIPCLESRPVAQMMDMQDPVIRIEVIGFTRIYFPTFFLAQRKTTHTKVPVPI